MIPNRQTRNCAPTKMNLIERLDYFSCPEPMSGCWLWTGYTNTKGTVSGGKERRKAGRRGEKRRITKAIGVNESSNAVWTIGRIDFRDGIDRRKQDRRQNGRF